MTITIQITDVNFFTFQQEDGTSEVKPFITYVVLDEQGRVLDGDGVPHDELARDYRQLGFIENTLGELTYADGRFYLDGEEIEVILHEDGVAIDLGHSPEEIRLYYQARWEEYGEAGVYTTSSENKVLHPEPNVAIIYNTEDITVYLSGFEEVVCAFNNVKTSSVEAYNYIIDNVQGIDYAMDNLPPPPPRIDQESSQSVATPTTTFGR